MSPTRLPVLFVSDLVVLPETLTYFGLGKSYADCAEPVPGPAQ